MSAFKVEVTPTRVSANAMRLQELRTPIDVVMAPFSAKSIVQFDGVPVTKMARRVLRIINPSEDPIQVKVTKPLNDDHNVSLSWTECMVDACAEVEMIMEWHPQLEVSCMETLQLTDNRNFRKDVSVILKTTTTKKPTKAVRKYPTVSSGMNAHVKTMRLKSPKGGNKMSKNLLYHAQRKRSPLKDERPQQQQLHLVATVSATNGSKAAATNTQTKTLPTSAVAPLLERNVQSDVRLAIESKAKTFTATFLPADGDDEDDIFDGELKENLSPSTPLSMLSMLDKMKFTPATETISKLPHLMDLASLPTPVDYGYERDSCCRPDIRPRRLTAAEFSMNESCGVTATSIPAIQVDMFNDTLATSITVTNSNNKTFEIKSAECMNSLTNLNTAVDAQDTTSSTTSHNMAAEPMNRTAVIPCTPYSRALEMIREEESFSVTTAAAGVVQPDGSQLKLDKTYNKPCCCGAATRSSKHSLYNQNLKRDISLVGSPLRKYSESMVELTIKSPSSSKICIQGSMPNLNEMESILSIEQNRYFHQSGSSLHGNSQTPRSENALTQTRTPPPSSTTTTTIATNAKKLNVSLELLNTSEPNADAMFNHNEILAQSSRFNLNDLGASARKCSPRGVWLAAAKVKADRSSPRSNANASSNEHHNRQAAAAAEKDANGLKRKSFEMSLSDSPSTESMSSVDNNGIQAVHSLKPPASMKAVAMKISPPKRQRFDSDYTFQRPASLSTPTNASAATSRNRSWSQVQQKKLKLSKTLSLAKKSTTPRKAPEAMPRVKLYDTDFYLQACINPDPFAATMTCDPFLASTMYLDECAVDRHQNDFKKWLNALVTLPPDFDTDHNATRIDVGKLFTEVRHKELQLAPSKEEQSLNYLTQLRLESLRRAAVQLYMSEAMRVPCSKVVVYVNKNALQMRSDRNLHLDVVMQRCILELLLCFSPLWLRLGLEVVYGEKIHLQSNSDIVGLSTFIVNRLFRDKFLEQKYSRAYTLSDEYAVHIKKYTLQKVLLLLLFLDKAKEARIVQHNPCLFVKKSPHKETKAVLLRFSSELLGNVGDVTRDLKRLGYVLQHKQTFLDEFDYAFNNLAVDLRDGIRLTRVMEIILLRDNLSRQLRVPAISRLQRVHNVNVALRALAEADFRLCGDIAAADIVDGHREKTLSLLWQIIYKFRSPKFHAAARTLQQWWRRQSLKVVVNRRIRQRIERRRQAAAVRIQAAFRGFITRQFAKALRAERTQAAIVLQKHVRRHCAQRRLQRSLAAVTRIQRWYRNQREAVRCRVAFLRLRQCVVFVQRCYRRRLMSVKLLAVAELAMAVRAQRREAAARCIQQQWRARVAGRCVRIAFQRQRQAAITLQRHYRAKRSGDEQQRAYAQLCRSVLAVQRRYRAKRSMLAQRQCYVQQRLCIIGVQRRWRATLAMRIESAAYARLRSAAIAVQRRWRAVLAMRVQRVAYKKTQHAVSVLQQHWRARVAMRSQRHQYQLARNHIVRLQQRWHATVLARREREQFGCLRRCTIAMQQMYRGKLRMRAERAAYQRLRAAAIAVQHRRRATLMMRAERARFVACRNAALTLQRWWRGHKLMRYQRAKFRGTRAAVTCLQQHWRAVLCMRQQRAIYWRQRNAACSIQRAWRATLSMQHQRAEYGRLRSAVICVQQRYRATVEMRRQVVVYHRARELIVAVQQRWRATQRAREEQSRYSELKGAAVVLQQRYRATCAMRRHRDEYQRCRSLIVQLQRRWRAQQQMRSQYATYNRQRVAATRIQNWYRSVQRMRSTRADYGRMRCAAIVLQQRYRAHLCAKQVRAQYLLIRSLVVCVQRRYRGHMAMRIERSRFLTLRQTVVWMQQRYRGRIEMRCCRASFQLLRHSTLEFQTAARGYLARQRFRALMTPEMIELLRQKKAVRVIQRYWRGYRIRKQFRDARLALIRNNLVALKKTSSAVNSIRYKLKYAVEHLLRDRYNVAESLTVLMQLERLSRTVPQLLMDHSSFISSFCYGIMSQAIRSEVDKQMIGHCSCIILNLARYNSTTANTFQRGGLTTIAQMLLRWCDKDTNIFNTLCTLIWIFAHCPQKREIIREFMTTTEAVYFMRETKKLVARKEKMNLNRQRATAQQLQNQRNKINFPSRALPSVEPDYGIICNRPYTFISSVYAFDVVLVKLGIKLY